MVQQQRRVQQAIHGAHAHANAIRPRTVMACALMLLLLGGVGAMCLPVATAQAQAATSNGTAQGSAAPAAGRPFTAEAVAALLPPSVYFAGRTAPLQLRNAGATKFADGTLAWVALVDSSGYSSSVQERYQFYLVTEGPLQFGNVMLKAGAYGGGFVQSGFVLMDLGDHTIGEGPVQTDADLHRPRPLQLVAEQPNAVKLYLGRRWVTLQSAPK